MTIMMTWLLILEVNNKRERQRKMKIRSDRRNHIIRGADLHAVEAIVGHEISSQSARAVMWQTEKPYSEEVVNSLKEKFWRSKIALNVQCDYEFEGDSYLDLAVW
jgi:hypothetical protein